MVEVLIHLMMVEDQNILLHCYIKNVSEKSLFKDTHENVHSSFLGRWISGLVRCFVFCLAFLLPLFPTQLQLCKMHIYNFYNQK